VFIYDWPSNRRINGNDGGHGVNLGSSSCFCPFGSFSLSVNRGTWYPRCCGRDVSYMYTGCLVIKSPHGVVSLTSYTPSRNRCGNGGCDALYQCLAESPS